MAFPGNSEAVADFAVAKVWQELESFKEQFEALVRGLRLFDEGLHAKVSDERLRAAQKRRSEAQAAPRSAAELLEVMKRPELEAFAGPLGALRQASRTCRLRMERRPERLLVFGGEDGIFTGAILRSNESLEVGEGCGGGTVDGGWEPLPPLRFARNGACAVLLRGKVYICGGSGAVARVVDRFTPGSKKWDFKVGAMQEQRHFAAAAVLKERIYICGGSDSSGVKEKVHDGVECFDPDDGERGKWSLEPYKMRQPRRHFGVAVLAGRLVACGGDSMPLGQLSRQRPTDSVDALSVGPHGRAAELPPMTEKRAGLGVAALRGCLYAAGGENTYVALPSVERYSAFARCWVSVAPLPLAAFCMGMVSAAGHIYAFGGSERSLPPGTVGPALSHVQRYDPEKDAWDLVESMGQARMCLAVVAVPP